MASTRITLDHLLMGPAVAFTRPGSRSAIVKTPYTGAVQVAENGLLGDEQGDLRVHGGPEKAIHYYPREHYAAWAEELGAHPLLTQAGAFGENFSATGWTEQTMCLADRVRVGSTLLEISQGRMPCWKLNDRFQVADMALRVQQTGRTGWYFRVLEGGVVKAGDQLEVVERPYEHWSLSRLSAVLFSKTVELEIARECLTLPLAASWRRTMERRVEKCLIEDWSPRIDGPAREVEA
ncbi:MOSC domain-containing protein [Pseudomonas sp. GD03944]|uniref:MOSC domain-containing protein n=1 Tax=Pseudomonas sp. GD03944 TaxID=2975409 RepID=UPI00244C7F7F|nr:MOSC domain-containing protein [Pseudomonas sp. GD03944]MDH1263419.1 MOSC domain-containing protein [Pseudomonas sp. GD03944]